MSEENRVREQFLDHVHIMIEFWEELEPQSRGMSDGQTELNYKLEGLAFSILTALDGGAGDLPGYEVKPLYDEYGNEYTEENPAPDIGGCLHELFHRKERR